MEKFELCYEILDVKPRQWLVPQLLHPSQPKYEWPPSGNLSLRYRYDFMPKGLMSRIIVRLHRFITRPDLAWQRGALFERLGTRAEIMETVKEKDTISIRVQGDDPLLRMEFRSIIDEEFDKLHKTFKNLKVEKLIPCNCIVCIKSPKPHFYEYSDLSTRLLKDKLTVECSKSYEDVNVKALLMGIGDGKEGHARKDKDMVEEWATQKQYLNRTPIEQLIANNNIPKALKLLRNKIEDHTETIMMESQWNKLREDENMGTLSYGITTQRRNQIIKAILDMAKEVQ